MDLDREISDYVDDQDEFFRARFGKVGYIPNLPFAFEITHTIREIRSKYCGLIEPGTRTDDSVQIAGRVTQKRDMGSILFLDIQNEGEPLQICANKKMTDPRYFDALRELDLGDIIGVYGRVMSTQRGELSIHPDKAELLSKALRPMPDKHSGLKNSEQRYRHRHLDMMANPEVIEIFKQRTRTFDAARSYLKSHGFLEVDTPVLQSVYGGANARPFVTRHNALDQEMYLRISNELYLKRLIIGGIPKVFEFARDFRNEGIDSTHNPEFTQLELYEAFVDYDTMAKRVQEIFGEVASIATQKIKVGDEEIDLSMPFKDMTMVDSVSRYAGINVSDFTDSQLKDLLTERSLTIKRGKFSRGRALVSLFEGLVEGKLVQPHIIRDHPIETSPLARRHRDNPEFTERFEVFIGGTEFGNAYSELNDALDQRARFHMQGLERISGDDEAHPMDEEFLRAMEAGMPPTGGLGIGMDRLVALITNQSSIKDVLLFPTMRHK